MYLKCMHTSCLLNIKMILIKFLIQTSSGNLNVSPNKGKPIILHKRLVLSNIQMIRVSIFIYFYS